MPNGTWEINAWSLMKAGGPVMIPILICAFFALAITIEKLIYLSMIETNVPQLKEKVFELIKNNHIKDAIRLCDTNQSPVAKILKAGVIKFNTSKIEIKESIEDASLFIIPKLESRLSALATIAHISPLLGLLGTVTGMSKCFYTIQIHTAALAPVSPSDLAGGIGEALITTIAGLIIAIPTYVAYNFFINRINHFILDMERAATELVNLFSNVGHSI